jgi:hypothetical protein
MTSLVKLISALYRKAVTDATSAGSRSESAVNC